MTLLCVNVGNMARQTKSTTTPDSKPEKPAWGRPTKLTEELVDKAEGYSKQCIGEMPTVEGMALYLDIDKSCLYDYDNVPEEDKTDLHRRFSHVFTRMKQDQAHRLINGGLYGRFNPVITKLMLSKHGYIEKKELDQTVKGDVTFVNDVPRGKK